MYTHAHTHVYIYIHKDILRVSYEPTPWNKSGVAFWMATVSIRENGEGFTIAGEWDLHGTDCPRNEDTTQQVNL